MSNSTSSEAADVQGKRKKLLPLAYALCIPAMVLLKMGFFFLVIGMLPTFLAFARMRRFREYVIGTVAAFNFAGVFPDLFSIMLQGGTPRAVSDSLSDITIWASMYGAGLLGWVIVWLSPSIARLFLDVIYRGRMRHMEHLQKKLEEEWGPEVKGRE